MQSNNASRSDALTRRSAFTAAGLGLAAIAGMPGRASAAEMSAGEKANVQIVNDFWPETP